MLASLLPVALLLPLPQLPWMEADQLEASHPSTGTPFGQAVDAHGQAVVVGSASEAKANIYQRAANGSWPLVAELSAASPQTGSFFANAVAIGGDTVAVGAKWYDHSGFLNAGAVYVFERSGGSPAAWTEVAKLTASNPAAAQFGAALDLDGDTLVVGAPDGSQGGAIHIFERDLGGPDNWGSVAVRSPSNGSLGDDFGFDVTIDGATIAAGSPGYPVGALTAGSIYVFERDLGGPDQWGEVAQVLPPSQQLLFGSSVAIGGDLLVSGGPDRAYVYERNEGGSNNWGLTSELVGSDTVSQDWFGKDVALFGNRALIGAPWRHTSGLAGSGAIYLFDQAAPGGAWSESGMITAAAPAEGDGLGESVALSGAVVLAGATGRDIGYPIESPTALAFDAGLDVLYAVDASDVLLRLEQGSGIARLIGPIGFTNVQGLAFDPSSGTLFGSDINTDQLISIDPATGQGSAVGPLGFDQVRGLAFDTSAQVLYGVDTTTDQLLAIDLGTGAGSALGAIGFNNVQGLTYEAASGRLLAAEISTDRLIELDPATGSATIIGDLSNGWTRGLADGSSSLFACDSAPNFQSGLLLEIDSKNGASAEIGSLFVLNGGAVVTFELEPLPYCTPGASASGCQALITGLGIASASSASGFSLSASEVEGNKSGLFFFGTSGRQAAPWGTSTSFQCVAPPVMRAGALAGIGNNASCDGAFTQDLNAFWCPSCSSSHKNPGAGITVQAQLWYRDPLNTSNQTSSFSNAVEFIVAP